MARGDLAGDPGSDPYGRRISMAEIGPADRVLSAGRPDLIAYLDTIVNSTQDDHGPELEAQVGHACRFYRRLAIRTAELAERGVPPNKLRNNSSWTVTEALYVGALDVLAAGFAVRYPKVGRPHPVREVKALVERRVGPLCTGWADEDGSVAHHTEYPCPIHESDDTPRA